MRVLWITNIVLPEASTILTGDGEMKSSGGWLLGSANSLISLGDVQLYVATVCNSVDILTKVQGKYITYYLLPLGKGNIKYNREYEQYWTQIKNEVKPDIVDIHGSEFSHGLAYIKACGTKNVVLTIQGLMSQIRLSFYGGLSLWDIISNVTVHDILSCEFLRTWLINKRRSNVEAEYLSLVENVIGRTAFDRAHTETLYPKLHYYHCSETLRSEFYLDNWEYSKCKKHSIMISQATSPLKGLHILLKAIAYIKPSFPDVELYVAGPIFPPQNSFMLRSYHKYIYKLIGKFGLKDNVKFVGCLSAEEMKKYLLKSNVMVCSSSCENSSNSISEAQLLGVPVIASCVGGTPSLVSNREEGTLYPFNDYLQLSVAIKEVFEGHIVFNNFESRKKIRERHDMYSNARELELIYNKIISSSTK